jgi:hypothetical protein
MGFWEVGVFEVFAGWDFGHNKQSSKANSTSAKGPKLVVGVRATMAQSPGSYIEKPMMSEVGLKMGGGANT